MSSGPPGPPNGVSISAEPNLSIFLISPLVPNLETGSKSNPDELA